MEEKEITEKDMKHILIKDLGMLYPTKNSKKKKRYGIFQCQHCGKEFKTRLANVKSGDTKSCGCLNGINHGLSYNRFYGTWNNMIGRCYNIKNKDYPHYGGRGIIVYNSWKDIKKFIKWAEETHIEGMTLDRIDNNKGYSPDNCRWADKTTQVLNRGIAKNNKSGYTGVTWHKRRKAGHSTLSVNKKRIILGLFKDKMKAVKVRDEYIIKNNLPHKLSRK